MTQVQGYCYTTFNELEVEWTLDFGISGSFVAQTFEQPAEYPEVEWLAARPQPEEGEPDPVADADDLRAYFEKLGVDVDALEIQALEDASGDHHD
jgi:hypothetical protein